MKLGKKIIRNRGGLLNTNHPETQRLQKEPVFGGPEI